MFGFYLSNHPVVKYKAKYNNIVNANEISKYFDKNIIKDVNNLTVSGNIRNCTF